MIVCYKKQNENILPSFRRSVSGWKTAQYKEGFSGDSFTSYYIETSLENESNPYLRADKVYNESMIVIKEIMIKVEHIEFIGLIIIQ